MLYFIRSTYCITQGIHIDVSLVLNFARGGQPHLVARQWWLDLVALYLYYVVCVSLLTLHALPGVLCRTSHPHVKYHRISCLWSLCHCS
jgi:hypothetical protein